mmetsp:Transcript_11887/g.18236  ORF Transcript_11887/g.18236 Transcript_11887/m.18236 type:complete len:246 (+) Transcript_11887:183-920(+)
MTATTTEPRNEYMEQRSRRIARNEQRLKDLGLMNMKGKKKPKRAVVRRKIQFESTNVVTRRSMRGKAKASLEMLSYQHDSDAVSIKQEEKEILQTPPPAPKFTERRRYRVHTTTVKALTEAQQKILQKLVGDNFLELFEHYLVHNDKISDQNLRSVMRQVSKLVNGEGVRYESPRYGWPEGNYFRKGFKVSPTDDFVELMLEAEECENEWGRDRGNGWLLSHPLKKLLNFQQFVLANQDAFDEKK